MKIKEKKKRICRKVRNESGKGEEQKKERRQKNEGENRERELAVTRGEPKRKEEF